MFHHYFRDVVFAVVIPMMLQDMVLLLQHILILYGLS